MSSKSKRARSPRSPFKHGREEEPPLIDPLEGRRSRRMSNDEINRENRFAAALKAPEAIIHVTGYSRSANHSHRHMQYVTRDNSLMLTSIPDDWEIHGKQEQLHFLSEHVAHYDSAGSGSRVASDGSKPKRKPREAVNLVISFPFGISPEKAKSVSHEFLTENFSVEYEGYFVLHTDTDNPHVHASINLRNSHTHRKLRIQPKTLKRWRRQIARIARNHGIHMTATSRDERGLPRPQYAKSEDALFYKRKRGELPLCEDQTFQAALSDFLSGNTGPTDYEKHLAEKTAAARRIMLNDADALIEKARLSSDAAKIAKLKVKAETLKGHADTLIPQPTQRQYYLQQLSRSLDPEKALALNENKPHLRNETVEFLEGYFDHVSTAEDSAFSKNHRFRLVDAVWRVSRREPPRDFRTNRASALAYVRSGIEEVKEFHKSLQSNPSNLNRWTESNIGHLPPSEKLLNYARMIARKAGATLKDEDLTSTIHTRAAIESFTREALEAEKQMEPSQKMLDLARKVAEEQGLNLDSDTLASFQKTRGFLRKHIGNTKNDRDEMERDD